MVRISCHCWEPPGVIRAFGRAEMLVHGRILSQWRGVVGTCFAPLLIEGATSGTAGWVRIDSFEKSSEVESVPRASTIRRRPWTCAWGEHVGAF
ncbi:hypothetical protein AVEN_41059-1 [Araneus ventricosus]|uniref:Uncharacterized protein n=1 Tax=Araneus ventricosus TaxID=182803 RepID=A0A4Y2CII2_ARAVE|nr:hypothetical protein AVEN_41059-1 [Araneus ventricosus]